MGESKGGKMELVNCKYCKYMELPKNSFWKGYFWGACKKGHVDRWKWKEKIQCNDYKLDKWRAFLLKGTEERQQKARKWREYVYRNEEKGRFETVIIEKQKELDKKDWRHSKKDEKKEEKREQLVKCRHCLYLDLPRGVASGLGYFWGDCKKGHDKWKLKEEILCPDYKPGKWRAFMRMELREEKKMAIKQKAEELFHRYIDISK